MLVYILTGLATFLSLRNYENIKTNELGKQNKWLKIFYKNCAIFILTIVFGLRAYSVGTDTKRYFEIFNRLGSKFTNKTYVYEKGFCFVSILTNKIFGNFTIFLLVFGFILHWNLITSFCELSKSPSISILCYFGFRMFAQSCNILRQYVALSFCLMALCYLLKKNSIIQFITYVFIGFLFHKTALVFLIVFPLKYIKFNIKNTLIVLVLFILTIPVMPLVVKVADSVFKGVKYSVYLKRQVNPFTFDNISTLLVMLIAIFLLIVFKERVKKLTKNIKEYDFFSNMFLLFVGVFIISVFTSELVNRISLFFMSSIFFVIPIVTKTLKNKTTNILIIFLTFTLTIIAFYLFECKGSYGVMPYIFI